MLRTVRVPDRVEPAFATAEQTVSRFFEARSHTPEQGTIEIFGERYILIRGASLSVEFFGLVEQLYGPGREAEAAQFARNFLFDLAHALGKSDARNFHRRMHLDDPIARLSAGPIHFAYTGWAFVDILPESRPEPGEDYYLLYDHPYSFESDAWLRAGERRPFPVCIMSAGYSSGWCAESFGTNLVASEVMCRASGDSVCRFIMAPPQRIEEHVARYVATRAEPGLADRAHEIPDFFSRKRAEEELSRLYLRLQELDTLKTQFFANVSHELRTPLTLVAGPVDRLLADGRLEPDQRSDLELVARSAQHLLGHVDDLLDIAKLEAGATRLVWARVDLAALVRSVAESFDGLARARALDYSADATGRLDADIDPERIGHVLLNVLSNAFDFARGVIRVRLRERDGRAIIEVADDGPGVPPEQREHVFERFRQVDSAATRRHGGTGLGLAIARELVELHGGEIHIDDAPEGGALVTVTLPLAAPAGVTVSSAPASGSLAPLEARIARRTETRSPPVAEGPALVPEHPDAPLVLIVEDSTDMARFLRNTLAAEYRVAVATDGLDGLEKARALMPDLVVTDVMMPRMSGDALIRELRHSPEMDATPILVLTARTDRELRIRLLGSGAQDYLAKPFSEGELLARARNLITVKRARDILQRELASKVDDLELLAREVAQKKCALEEALAGMRAARDEAEHASRAKTMFLGLVSHELTTPLQSMRLTLESLVRRPEGLSEAHAAKLTKISRASERLFEMVESLLEFARIESGRLELHPEEVSVPDAARSVLDTAAAAASDKGLELRLAADDDVPKAIVDARLLRLVLVNLVGNAVKYTDQGHVEVGVTCDGAAHRVTVSDTGRGIPKEEIARIFEPFTQLEPLDHKHSPGVGLGLSLVRETVKALGARISVSSEVGAGSTFTLELPRT